MTCHLAHRYSHLQPLIYSFSNYYEQKTPLFIQKRGFEFPIKSSSLVLKGESNQVNELQFPFSGERISLKLLKNQTENKGGIIPFLESPEGKAVLVSL
jgi:hypothetical protein